jgi:hypothetical protein
MAFSIALGQSRMVPLDPVPILAMFAWRSATAKPPRFAKSRPVHATLAVCVEMHGCEPLMPNMIRERPESHLEPAIRESRIASSCP